MKEKLGTKTKIELPYNEQRVNTLLKDKSIVNELVAMMSMATFECRQNPESRHVKPSFLLVADFQTALYSPERKTVYLDSWNVPHSSIAMKKGLLAKDEFDCQISKSGNYISGDVCVLRGAEDVKVIAMNTLFGFSREDLTVLRKLGYSVLSPNWNWLFEGDDKIGNETITSTPSAFSAGQDYI